MTVVDLELACNLVQAKLRTLSGIQHAPDMENYMNALHDAVCPYAMTWPGAGSWAQKGHGYKQDARTLQVFVFVESLAQKDIPTRTVQATRLLSAARNLFATASNIPLDDGATSGFQITVESRVDDPQSDTGLVANLPFSGIPWFGFTLMLKVRLQWIV